MAIVFISPKQKQRVFFTGITGIFAFLLLMIALFVFLAKPKEVAPDLVFNKPKININLDLLNSDQFKRLEPFSEMEMQFVYTGTTIKGKSAEGKISAVSIEEARAMLEQQGLTVSEIKEAEVGRENPFTPYYQAPPAPKPK